MIVLGVHYVYMIRYVSISSSGYDSTDISKRVGIRKKVERHNMHLIGYG